STRRLRRKFAIKKPRYPPANIASNHNPHMPGILDSMTRPHQFFPENVTEYTALQLAKKLGDTDRLWKYVSLFRRQDSSSILEAFQNAQRRGRVGKDLISAFEEQLTQLTNPKNEDPF